MDGNGKYAPRPGNIRGVAMNLGGIDFVLAPLGLGLARDFQDKTRALVEGKSPEYDFIELGISTIHASLLRNYPDITLDEVRALVDTVTVQEAVRAITDSSGLRKVTPGELTRGVTLTGTDSMPTSVVQLAGPGNT